MAKKTVKRPIKEQEIIAKKPRTAEIKEPELPFNNFDSIDKITLKEEKEIPNRDRFAEFDKRDEEQIKMITNGMIISEPFFESDGMYSISYDGTIRLIAEQKNVRVIGQPLAEHDEDYYNYTVTAEDTKKNVSVYGMGQCYKYKTDYNGNPILENNKKVLNRYAKITALTFAQRNAFRKLINQDKLEEKFREWYYAKYGKSPKTDILLVSSSYKIGDISK